MDIYGRRRIGRIYRNRQAGEWDVFPNVWTGLVMLAIVAALSCLVMLLPLLHPLMIGFVLVYAFLLGLVGFVMGAIAAYRSGTWAAPDFLDDWGWFIVARFLVVFVVAYLIAWFVMQVNCAMQHPRRFLPWVGLQLCAAVVVVGGIGTTFAGGYVRTALLQPGPAEVQPAAHR
jgi:hypothetical protein